MSDIRLEFERLLKEHAAMTHVKWTPKEPYERIATLGHAHLSVERRKVPGEQEAWYWGAYIEGAVDISARGQRPCETEGQAKAACQDAARRMDIAFGSGS